MNALYMGVVVSAVLALIAFCTGHASADGRRRRRAYGISISAR